ncbi:MAG: ATP-binding protein [Lachnospiraceae bacterium]
MKLTIRYRITLIFAGLTILVMILLWGANYWLLEGYYINEKIQALENAYNRIDTRVQELTANGESILKDFSGDREEAMKDSSSLAFIIREFSEKYNTAIVMVDSVSGDIIYSSARDQLYLSEQLQRYIFGKNIGRPSETLRTYENYNIQKNFDPRSKASYMESWGFFSDNSTIFIMSTPLTSIRDSVAISNRFLAYIGAVAIVGSCVLIYFTAKKITSPIMELADLSERMSNLDFEATYTGEAKDELGVLGNSMNVLAETLKETIGELKSANIELQRDIEEKVQIDEMRKEFIANVSHELKTPIALIQGYAEGLVEGLGDDKETRDYYCDVIMDETKKMNIMVRQLLTLTALESGNDAPVLERFDIVELIRGVLNKAQILIEQKEAVIEFAVDHPVYVWADEFKIEEVVTNYISNALNHLDDKKQIRIHVQETDLSDPVKVSVFNTGAQIPPEALENLWTKFYKVDKARTRAYGGSGIGLSIVKAIMDAHHQQCGVDNLEDGVEFWFTVER